MNKNAQEVICRLQLQPLVGEGGFFRFQSAFGENSGYIYYLITPEDFSHLHSLTVDELYFFLVGDAVCQTIVHPDGTVEKHILDAFHRDYVVPKNCYQASRLAEPKLGYALVATVMNPSYQQEMYRAGKDDEKMRSLAAAAELL